MAYEDKQRTRSTRDETKLNADEKALPFSDDRPPGSSLNGDRDIHIEGLGYLSQFPDAKDIEDRDEGIGPWCVCLSEYLSGGEGNPFQRGDVRRLSKFVPVMEKEEVLLEVKQAAVKRLLSLEAIRFADADEVGHKRIILKDEEETPEVRREKLRAQQAEAELAELKEQMRDFMERSKSGESIEDIEAGRVSAVQSEAPASSPQQQAPATTSGDDDEDEDFGPRG
jgi:hypothetical protein